MHTVIFKNEAVGDLVHSLDAINNIISSKDNDKVTKHELSSYLNVLINDLEFNGFFKPVEKKESMIDNIYSIYNKIDLSKKELRMMWGMHKKLKNQPKS